MKKTILLFTLLCAHALNGMEIHKQSDLPVGQPSPITLAQTYYHFSHYHFSPDLLPSEIVQHIFWLQLGTVYLANLPVKIEQKSPEPFVKYLETLITSCGYLLASELCEFFLKHKKISLCDIQDEFKNTCLHWAYRSSKVMAMLIKIAGNTASTLIAMQNNFSDTALHQTALNNRTENVKLILDAAGDNASTLLAMQNNSGSTALHCAASYNYIESIKLILDTAGNTASKLLAMQNKSGSTALHCAAIYNYIESINLILDAAGNTASKLLAMKNNSGGTALYWGNRKTKEVMQKYMANNK
jgi:ankyrin repeat protein